MLLRIVLAMLALSFYLSLSLRFLFWPFLSWPVQDGRTALRAAAGAGHLAAVEALLEAGASVDTPDKVRIAFLHLAEPSLNIPTTYIIIFFFWNYQTCVFILCFLHRLARPPSR